MRETSILASGADYGTKSISESFFSSIEYKKKLLFGRGFKKMGLKGWWSGFCFIRSIDSENSNLLCLFNAPILLAAIFRNFIKCRVVGVLDWTESYPSCRKSIFTFLYDRFYLWAFSRLDSVYSPSEGFCNYYNRLGANVQTGLYPMPFIEERQTKSLILKKIRVLYIGADINRKGGDILLKKWSEISTENASLTFVTPTPPIDSMKGVEFIKNLKSGTKEHRMLFSNHDLLILPTKMEPFGYVLLEAISAGLFVVTTSAAGARAIVSQAGGIVAPTPEAALDALFNLLGYPEEITRRIEICLNYKKKYQENFSNFIKHACLA